jgi:hypothetical protein
MDTKENGAYGTTVKTIVINEMYNVSVGSFFYVWAISLNHRVLYMVKLSLKEMFLSCLVVK